MCLVYAFLFAVKTECKSDSCKNGGTCTEMAMGRHLCTCAVGYRGDDCEGSLCFPAGQSLINFALVSLMFTQLPRFRSEISRCHPNPCRNGGTCSETDESFVCLCPEGYKGKTCAGRTTDIPAYGVMFPLYPAWREPLCPNYTSKQAILSHEYLQVSFSLL